MASSLFGNNQNPTLYSQPAQDVDPVAIAEAELQQSGGNAKAAFYSLAKKKGVDPNSVLEQIKSIQNPMKVFSSLMNQNSKIGSLVRLFGGMK